VCRRRRSAVIICTNWRRRVSKALNACACASGRGRGVGRTASAKCASPRASRRSVFANRPVALAKSRAWRGFTTTTGRPASARAPGRGPPNPPGRPRQGEGGRDRLQPLDQAYDPCLIIVDVPAGIRRTQSHIQLGLRDVNPDKHLWIAHSRSSSSAQPCAMRTPTVLATVRALARRDVTTPAHPRPLTTRGASACDVPCNSDQMFHLHILSLWNKDTRGGGTRPWPKPAVLPLPPCRRPRHRVVSHRPSPPVSRIPWSAPFSMTKADIGLTTNPRTPAPQPVAFFPQWSSGLHIVTFASLQVISLRLFHNRFHRKWRRPEFLYACAE